MGFIWSIIIGIVAGYLAGKIMRGGGFGVIVNLILGIIGGVLGGWVFSLLGISAGGILGSLITSTVGAILLLWIGSLFNKAKEGEEGGLNEQIIDDRATRSHETLVTA